MRRLMGILVVFAVFFGALIIVDIGFNTFTMNVQATTYYVGGSGGGNYTTIQEAIDAANPGDMVYVYAGTYDESLVIDKTLTLLGEDKQTTIVNATGSTFGIHISSADYVNLSGFTISGANSYNLKLSESNNTYIHDNILNSSIFCAIGISPGSDNIIEDNQIANNLRGFLISGDSSRNKIQSNEITSCGDRAVTIEGGANENIVSDNTISGYLTGIYIYESEDNRIENNHISDGDEGVKIFDLASGILLNNIIEDNNVAVRVYDSALADIINCTLLNSDTYDLSIGDVIWSDGDVTLINTTFDEGKVNILDDASNLTVNRFLTVKVVDDDDEPVAGVTIEITDGIRIDIGSGENHTTNSEGFVKWIPLTSYWQTSSGKVYHKPYFVIAYETPSTGTIVPDVDMNSSQQVAITFHSDTDGDGVYDIFDPFPDDPSQWDDTDDDGFGDNATGSNPDAFPEDPAASKDTDGDGYPDSWNTGMSKADSTTGLEKDAFPDDPDEWKDSDGDGIGDNSDFLPNIDNTIFFLIVGLVVVAFIIIIVLAISKKRKKKLANWNEEEKKDK